MEKAVREFTEESLDIKLPNHPRLMNENEVIFLVKMMLDELYELLLTVQDQYNARKTLNSLISNLEEHNSLINTNEEDKIIAAQMDALVDSHYYALNAAAKVGCNLQPIFKLVHNANMAKKFPDGTFHRRDDGKVIKPPGWKEPDIINEIKRQKKEGAFI
ncbi:MAG: hypothetical protein QW303_00010 [Nitrososphaerota archaeon]